MKKFFTGLLLVMGMLSCQPQKSIFKATYSFEDNSSSANGSIAALIFDNISYEIQTDGKLLLLTPNFVEVDEGYVQVVNSGPKGAMFDIKNNYVSFDTDTLFRYARVKFKKTGNSITMGNYICNIALTQKGDSIYYSKKIPSYVNPFFLNNLSIGSGVVRAAFVNNGIYNLQSLTRVNGKNIDRSIDTSKKVIRSASNIFFQ